MSGAAVGFLEREFGGPVDENESVVATAVTAGSIIGNDPEGMSLTFVNLGTFAVYLALDARVSATRGIYLAPNGGAVSLSVRDDGTLPAREWFAISPGGASTVYALRVRRRSLVQG